MLKKICFGMIILLLLPAACELANKVEVEPVLVSALPDYGAGTTLAQTKEAALESVITGLAESIGTAMEAVTASPEFQAQYDLNKFLAQLPEEIRTVLGQQFTLPGAAGERTYNGDLTIIEPSSSRDGLADINMLILNEAIENNGNSCGMIDLLDLDLKVEIEMDEQGNPVAVTADTDAEAELNLVELGNVEAAIINAKLLGDGNGTITYNSITLYGATLITPDTLTVEYNIGATASAGLTITGGNGGRFIVDFLYSEKKEFSIDLAAKPQEDLAGKLELTLEIDVYDNNDTMVDSYSYTPEELLAQIAEFDELFEQFLGDL